MSATASQPRLPWLNEVHFGALRLTLAAVLSCTIAFALELAQPGWAITTAVIVSLPSLGAIVSKSLARAGGTVIAALMVQVIACFSLNDSHLLIIFTILWVTLCTFIASLYRGDKAYAWAVAGFTAAIIAFSAASAPDPVTTFYVTEARVSEVLVGIVSALTITAVLPASQSDKDQLITSFRALHQKILDHAYAALLDTTDLNQLRSNHIQLSSQALDLNLLKLQTLWLHRSIRRKNTRISAILHCQLHLLTILTEIRQLTKTPHCFSSKQTSELTKVFDSLKQGIDPWSSMITLRPESKTDALQWAIYQQLRLFVRLFTSLDSRYNEELTIDEDRFTQKGLNPQCSHADMTEALKNAFRTLLASSFSAWFWISSGWPDGGLALTFTAACCTMLPSMPGPDRIAKALFKAFMLLVPFVLLYKFGWMQNFNSIVPVAITLPPVIYLLAYRSNLGGPYALTLAFSVVLMPALLGIDYLPSYDPAVFINTSAAMSIGILSPLLAFKLISPSSEKQRAKRLVSNVKTGLAELLTSKKYESNHQFELFIYDTISQLRLSSDEQAKAYLLRNCIEALMQAHTIWKLKNHHCANKSLAAIQSEAIKLTKNYLAPKKSEEGKSDYQEVIDSLREMIRTLETAASQEYIHMAALLWQLKCNLPLLEKTSGSTENN